MSLSRTRTRLLSALVICWVSTVRAESMYDPLTEKWVDVIPYEVTAVDQYGPGSVDGLSAYENKRRGSYDWEPMAEVRPQDAPIDLPPPTVVQAQQSTVIEEFNGVRIRSTEAMKTEDKIFLQIAEDEKKARCFILNEGCPSE